VEWKNNCVPNCASGKFRHHRVNVLFYRIRPVRHHAGEYHFTRLKTDGVKHVL
jgi:hypothetical protein